MSATIRNRHTWLKVPGDDPHDVCEHCDLQKRIAYNDDNRRVTRWTFPDGRVVDDPKTPPCQPKPADNADDTTGTVRPAPQSSSTVAPPAIHDRADNTDPFQGMRDDAIAVLETLRDECDAVVNEVRQARTSAACSRLRSMAERLARAQQFTSRLETAEQLLRDTAQHVTIDQGRT